MRRIGQGHGPSYAVANLASICTVCAIALDGTDDWADDIASSARQDIKHVLELAALLAVDACCEVEKLEAKQPARMTGGDRNG